MESSKTSEDLPKKSPKKIPPGSLELMFAGDLVLPRCQNKSLTGLFRRYQVLFEGFANMERDERILNYKFVNALMMTAHAKKIQDNTLKKRIFDFKNDLFLDIANNPDTRRKVVFRYLVSPRIRVEQYCQSCETRNTAEGLPRHKWKFCDKCKVDRDFFNVLSMRHKFTDGFSTLFLSRDRMNSLRGFKLPPQDKLENAKEETVFQNYHFNIQNLDAFTLDSVMKFFEKLMKK